MYAKHSNTTLPFGINPELWDRTGGLNDEPKRDPGGSAVKADPVAPHFEKKDLERRT